MCVVEGTRNMRAAAGGGEPWCRCISSRGKKGIDFKTTSIDRDEKMNHFAFLLLQKMKVVNS